MSAALRVCRDALRSGRSAVQTTLPGAQPAPARRPAEEASGQAGRLGCGMPWGLTGSGPSPPGQVAPAIPGLCWQPVELARRLVGQGGPPASSRGWQRLGLQVHLLRPGRKMGAPQSGDGAFSHTPPPAFRWRPALGTREPCEAGAGQGRGGKRAPNAMPEVLTGVGRGIGGRAQESWAPRRRTAGDGPSPWGSWAPREPANAPAVHGEGPGELEQGAQLLHGAPWRPTKGAAPGVVQVARTVLNGGMRQRTIRRRALSLPNGNVKTFALRRRRGGGRWQCLRG